LTIDKKLFFFSVPQFIRHATKMLMAGSFRSPAVPKILQVVWFSHKTLMGEILSEPPLEGPQAPKGSIYENNIGLSVLHSWA
jgi:hypothetical protein